MNIKDLHNVALQLAAELFILVDTMGQTSEAVFTAVAADSAVSVERALGLALLHMNGKSTYVPSLQSMENRARFWRLSHVAMKQDKRAYIYTSPSGDALAGVDFGSHKSEVAMNPDLTIRNTSWFISVERGLGI